MSGIKAIRYESPARYADSVYTIGKGSEMQLFCKVGNNLFLIKDSNLSDAVNSYIGRFLDPYPITIFSCGRRSDQIIEELYQELVSCQTDMPLPVENPGKCDPTLLTLPSPGGISHLEFTAEDDLSKVYCRMYFDALARIDNIILYANDFGDTITAGGTAQFFRSLNREKKNTAIITFDWPRHGADQQTSLRPEDCSNYLATLCAYVRTHFDPKKISVLAVGFGAYCVMRYIRDNRSPFNRIVLLSPILSTYDNLFDRLLTEQDREALMRDSAVHIGLRSPIKMERAEIKAFMSDNIALDNFAEKSDDLLIVYGSEEESSSVESLELFANVNNIRFKKIVDSDRDFTNPAKREEAYREALAFLFSRTAPAWKSDPNAAVVRRGYIFHGKVYGVGFCWRALAYANDVGASGWVQEKSDGSVHMLIESTQAQIDLVLMRLMRAASVQIKYYEQVEPDRMKLTVSETSCKKTKREMFSWGKVPFLVGGKERLKITLSDSDSVIALNKERFVVSGDGFKVYCKLYSLKTSEISSDDHDSRSAASKHFSQVILYGHGSDADKESAAAEHFAESYLENHRSAAIVTFDLPGHGADESITLTLSRCDTYLCTVIDYIRKYFDTHTLFAYGTDLSGYLFLNYLQTHGNPFKGLALLCPVISMAGDSNAVSEKRRPEARYPRSDRLGKNIKSADVSSLDFSAFHDCLFILHGTDDKRVSCKSIKAFADRNGILFIPVKDADHFFLEQVKINLAIQRITEFFDSLCTDLSLSDARDRQSRKSNVSGSLK